MLYAYTAAYGLKQGNMNVARPQLSGSTEPAPEIPPGGKVLILGSTGHANVTCVEWGAEPPNIVDFHVCIVAVKGLSDEVLRSQDAKYFSVIAYKLRRLLLSKGKVIVTSDQFRRVKRKEYPDSITNYHWCPLNPRFQSEQGDTVQLSGNRFSGYLAKLKRWSFHYHCTELDEQWVRALEKDERYGVSTKPLATNREGRLLAASHTVSLYRGKLRSHGYGESYMEWPDQPSQVCGELVFLPPLQDLDGRETIATLLGDLGLKEVTPPPDWVTKLSVPGSAEVSASIDDTSAQIDALQQRKAELAKELSALQRWTGLLYATGPELEEIFRESLIALGARVERAKYANEEYIVRYRDGEILCEIKGNSKSVSLDNLRQLLDYTLHFQKDTGKEGKGVLFGNAWRLIPPDQRDTNDKPYFPDDVKRAAAKFGVSLVSSKAYFEVFCRFLRGEVDGQYILERIAQTNGVVVF